MSFAAYAGLCIFLVMSGWVDVVAAQGRDATTPLPGRSIYNLSSQWTTDDGQKVNLTFLRGRPVIVAMIYTSCADTCPLVIQNMLNIHSDISGNARQRSRFALFSFDSARDTPGHLKAFAKGLHLDPAHWTLLQGDDNAVRELAAALGVRYRRKPNGDFDHSVLISLLDADGVLEYQQAGLQIRSRELETRLEALVKNRP